MEAGPVPGKGLFMNRKEFGHAGEDLAAAYLELSGHTILERGFTERCGEIDIIAEKEGVLHFVEVKTRSTDRFGLPSEAVDRRKLSHIRNVAAIYMDRTEQPYTGCRIDVIEVGVHFIEGVTGYAR